ncbi:hypothetical protein [Haloarcula pellucida]|uniref:Uncharacterized protein n=1 Tax=Haloarcula pellucida TaxID=1427151 RepID=A0A830GKM3_9EURY|nr:hypothetical protein [Halomicroarcula pellucida]MBX0348680.1 hypothetical protein [Halomicroarcula pellucida]GGN92254.1 hypothetical protein GCM10009030_16290 [Halomicroarcula pellucida]
MTDAYALRTLGHPAVVGDAVLGFVALGFGAFSGGAAAASESYHVLAPSVLLLLGGMVLLKWADERARGVARQNR